MDIKKKATLQPKTFDRTIKVVTRTRRSVKQVEKSVRKGKRDKEQIRKDENAYAAETAAHTAKDVRKRAIRASYSASKRLYRWNKDRKGYRFSAENGGYATGSVLRLNAGNGRQREAPVIKTRLQVTNGSAVPQFTRAAAQARQMDAFRKNTIRNGIKHNAERVRKAAKTAKRGFEAVVSSVTAVFRSGKAAWLIAGAAGQAALVVCVVALIAAILSPFAFLFGGSDSVDEHPSLAEVASDINAEYTARFKKIIDEHDYVDEVQIKDYETDSANYVASNWKDILSVWSVSNDLYTGEAKTDEDLKNVDSGDPVDADDLPYVMTDQNICSLKNMFWQFNEINYEIKTEEVEIDGSPSPEPVKPANTPEQTASSEPETKTVRTLIISPVSRDYLWGADQYHMNDEQRGWLEELMSDTYAKEWSKLLLGIVGMEMTDVQKQLLDSLPAGPGSAIALNASTRLGHPYSKQKRGQGLYVDCSYLARWCYREAGYTWFTAATAAEQARWCDNNGCVVERSKLKAGDLLFYSFAKNGRYKDISHVAVYVGRAKDGKEYMIDASSSNGFVVYREVFSDKSLVMCGRPLMYLDNH